MASITRAEVKQYIRLNNTVIENESVSLPATTDGVRLAYQFVNSVLRVTTSTDATSPRYTTADYYLAADLNDYSQISNIATGSMSTGGDYLVSYDYCEYNDDIDLFIPQVEKDICDWLNNYFEDPVIFAEYNGGLAFVKGATTADYIEDDNDLFSTIGLTTGMDIAVRGGSNGGIYTLAGVSTNKLTLDSTGELVSQDQDNTYNPPGSIRISRVNWPKSIKPYIAQLVWFRINRSRPDNVASERIDDYSVTYINGNAYPTEVLNGLRKFRNAVLV